MFHHGEEGEFVWATQEELEGILKAHREHLEVFFFFFFIILYSLFFHFLLSVFDSDYFFFSDPYLGYWSLFGSLVLGSKVGFLSLECEGIVIIWK